MPCGVLKWNPAGQVLQKQEYAFVYVVAWAVWAEVVKMKKTTAKNAVVVSKVDVFGPATDSITQRRFGKVRGRGFVSLVLDLLG